MTLDWWSKSYYVCMTKLHPTMGRPLATAGGCSWQHGHVQGLLWLLIVLGLQVTANFCPHRNNRCSCQPDACSQQLQQTVSSCHVAPVGLCQGLFYRQLPDGFKSDLLTVTNTGHHFYDSQTIHFNFSINSLLPFINKYNIVVEGQWDGQSMSSFNETYVVSISQQNNSASSLVEVSMKCGCRDSVLTSVRITILVQKDNPCDIVQANSIVIVNDTSKVKVKRENGSFSVHYDKAAYTLSSSIMGQTNCSGTIAYCPLGDADDDTITRQPDKVYNVHETQCLPYFVYLEFCEKSFQDAPQCLEYWVFYMLPDKSSAHLPSSLTLAVNSRTSSAYQGPDNPSTVMQTSSTVGHTANLDKHFPPDQEIYQPSTAGIRQELSHYFSAPSTTVNVPVETSYSVHLSTEHSVTISSDQDISTARENLNLGHNTKSWKEDDVSVSVLVVVLVIVVGACSLLFFRLRKNHACLLPHPLLDNLTLKTRAGSDACSEETAARESPLLLLYYKQDNRHAQLVSALCSHLQTVGTVFCCIVGDTVSLNTLHDLLQGYKGRVRAILVLCSGLRHILCSDEASTAAWRKCIVDDIRESAASFSTVSFNGELSERDKKYFHAMFGVEKIYQMSGQHRELTDLKLNQTTDDTSLLSECLTVNSFNV